jgi:hypothetical protein
MRKTLCMVEKDARGGKRLVGDPLSLAPSHKLAHIDVCDRWILSTKFMLC